MPTELPIVLHDNRLNDCTPTATSTAAGYDVLNLRDFRPYTAWKGTSATDQAVKCALASAKTANCVAMLRHNLSTVGSTVSVECSSDDFVADTTVALPGFAPGSDRAILKTFTQQNKQYWRVNFKGNSAAPEVAILMLGNMIQFPYPEDGPIIPYNAGMKGVLQESVEGDPLGAAVLFRPFQITARFSNLSRTFVLETLRDFWEGHASILKPFFYATDIGTFPDFVFYATVKPNSRFAPPMSMLSIVDSITLDMQAIWE